MWEQHRKPPTAFQRVTAPITEAIVAAMAVARPAIARAWAPVERALTVSILIRGRQWNPCRLDAFFWGQRDPAFSRGVGFSAFLHVFIVLMLYVLMRLQGCDEYLMPLGGGSNELMGKRVIVARKPIKKQKKMRYVVNPLNPIKYEIPEYEKIIQQKLDQLFVEEMRERYAVGHQGTGTGKGPLGEGEGDASGYGSGNPYGKVRFIRLQYAGSAWDNNMGKGADYNMLLEYKIRTGQKVAEKTESITMSHLAAYKKFYAPPYVYITGDRKLSASDREVAIVRKYLLENHGMLFADVSAPGWGREFKGFMRRVLPEVQPIYIPHDDDIMRQPYPVGKLPYVSQHEPPMRATGWKVQGRWVAFYHPGDLADAWKDGHSGVTRQVAEDAYELGVNIIHYAHRTYSQWFREKRGGRQ